MGSVQQRAEDLQAAGARAAVPRMAACRPVVPGAPTPLLDVRQVAQAVDGHHPVGQGRLAAAGAGGQQSPAACGPFLGQDGLGAAVAVAGLGHAADGFKRAGSEVAHEQDLYDRPVGVVRVVR